MVKDLPVCPQKGSLGRLAFSELLQAGGPQSRAQATWAAQGSPWAHRQRTHVAILSDEEEARKRTFLTELFSFGCAHTLYTFCLESPERLPSSSPSSEAPYMVQKEPLPCHHQYHPISWIFQPLVLPMLWSQLPEAPFFPALRQFLKAQCLCLGLPCGPTLQLTSAVSTLRKAAVRAQTVPASRAVGKARGDDAASALTMEVSFNKLEFWVLVLFYFYLKNVLGQEISTFTE